MTTERTLRQPIGSSGYREDRYGHSAYRKHHRRHWRDYDNNSYRREGGVRLELNF